MLLFKEIIEALDSAFPERLASRSDEEKALLQNASIQNVRIDSREVEKGDLFVCLPGDRVHGHSFLEEAFNRGARFAFVEEDFQLEEALAQTLSSSFILIRVPDTLAALQMVAKSVVDKEQPEIIAITGAMGKTTTRQFLFHLLEGQKEIEALLSPALSEAEGALCFSEAIEQGGLKEDISEELSLAKEAKSSFIAQSVRNFNSQAGLPTTILNELKGHKLWVVEMAMTEAGDIKSLAHIAPPSYAVITQMPSEIEDYIHAAAFETIEDAVHAKCEIFESEKLKMAFLPDDLPDLEAVMNNIYTDRCLFSFTDPIAEFFCEVLEVDKSGANTQKAPTSSFAIYERGEKKLQVDLYFPKHHVRNFFIGVVIARKLGLSWEKIEERKGEFVLPKMRFEEIEKGGITFISDAYNASPEAMRLAIDALPDKGGKKLAVLGEVLVLGKHAPKGHEKALRFAEKKLDHIFCYGKNWEGIEGNFTLFQNKEDVIQAIIQTAKPGDVVLIKGSRGCYLEKVLSGALDRL